MFWYGIPRILYHSALHAALDLRDLQCFAGWQPASVRVRGLRLCSDLCYAAAVRPILTVQERPLDHPESVNHFQVTPEKLFVATSGAIEMYSQQTIIDCLHVLQEQAEMHDGMDYLRILEHPEKSKPLWFF